MEEKIEEKAVKSNNEGYEVHKSWYDLYDYINKNIFMDLLGSVIFEFVFEDSEFEKCEKNEFLAKIDLSSEVYPVLTINVGYIRFFSLREIFLILCHEMVHYKTHGNLNFYDMHGKVFQHEMKKIGIEEEWEEDVYMRGTHFIKGGLAEKCYNELREKGFKINLNFPKVNKSGVVIKDEEKKEKLPFGLYLSENLVSFRKRFFVKNLNSFIDDEGKKCSIYRLYKTDDDEVVWIRALLDSWEKKLKEKEIYKERGVISDEEVIKFAEDIIEIEGCFRYLYGKNYSYVMKEKIERWCDKEMGEEKRFRDVIKVMVISIIEKDKLNYLKIENVLLRNKLLMQDLYDLEKRGFYLENEGISVEPIFFCKVS